MAYLSDVCDFCVTKRSTNAKWLKPGVTIRSDADSVDCFETLAEELCIP